MKPCTYQAKDSHHRHGTIGALVECETCFVSCVYAVDFDARTVEALESGGARSLDRDELEELHILVKGVGGLAA